MFSTGTKARSEALSDEGVKLEGNVLGSVMLLGSGWPATIVGLAYDEDDVLAGAGNQLAASCTGDV